MTHQDECPAINDLTALLIEHGPDAFSTALATFLNHAMHIERERSAARDLELSIRTDFIASPLHCVVRPYAVIWSPTLLPLLLLPLLKVLWKYEVLGDAPIRS